MACSKNLIITQEEQIHELQNIVKCGIYVYAKLKLFCILAPCYYGLSRCAKLSFVTVIMGENIEILFKRSNKTYYIVT